MGKQILYCADCGRSLYEEDFRKRRAQLAEKVPYCSRCRPLPPEADPPPAAAPGETPRSGTGRVPKADRPPTARGVRAPARSGAAIGAAAAAVAVFVVVIAIASSGGRPDPVPRTAHREPATPPLPPPDPAAEERARKAEVERFQAKAERERRGKAEAEEARRRLEADADARRKAEAEAEARRKADAEAEARKKAEAKAESDRKARARAALLREIEELKDPEEILRRCAEAKPALKGKPEEARLREIEAGALATRAEKEKAAKAVALLEEARKIAESDRGYARCAEVRERLGGALEADPARRPEVERTREAYEKGFEQAARFSMEARRAEARRLAGQKKYAEAVAAIDEYPEAFRATKPGAELAELRKEYEKLSGRAIAGKRTAGPYPLDDKGQVGHWLILGVFPNPKGHAGFDVDYLKGEDRHLPAAGLEVEKDGGRAKWEPAVVPGGEVHFFKLGALVKHAKDKDVLAYAACWLESDRDQDVELHVAPDDGFRLLLNGRLAGEKRSYLDKLGEARETCKVRLGKGLNAVLLKVGTDGGGFAFTMRVLAPSLEKAPGVRVWN